jgi:large subunit ribosomal protein L37
MMSFGHSMALAKHMYGVSTALATSIRQSSFPPFFQWDVTELPQPISTQCLLTDGESFTFCFFQLNTLRMDSEDGIKNMAWIDADHKLFNKILPKRAMLRNTKYQDYDPEIFRKVAAMYLYGAKRT